MFYRFYQNEDIQIVKIKTWEILQNLYHVRGTSIKNND